MYTTAPLFALRELLRSRGLDGMLVPRADAHQSEDCAAHDNTLAFLTGFTGSAGLALVLQDRALLFVDGRYQVQARHQVDTGAFELHHLHNEPVADWIKTHLPPGLRIAFEPLLIVSGDYDALRASGCQPVALEDSPFDTIWPARPPAPQGKISAMPLALSGESSTNKRQRLAATLDQAGADWLAVTQPDNIAWLLNVRGADVPMSPAPLSFVLVSRSGELEWFVDRQKVESLPAELLADLTLAAPHTFVARCQELAVGNNIMLDSHYAPVAVRFAVERGGGTILWGADPITLMKAQKNVTELAGYRECHIADGAAWVNFLAWLSREVPQRETTNSPVTELEAQQVQLAFRQQATGFLEPSFATISAAGSNAAMCHYHSSAETNRALTSDSFYLNDSGGQYLSGTTDATRTLAFRALNTECRRHYTAVLKGFLSLITLQFPRGTQGHQLDAFARRYLWDLGLDYDHGTGHGVGHRLYIHEQPHRMAKKVNPWPLLPGTVITIEPGFYLAEQHGIRIENQVEIVESMPGFCRFESLTLIPIDLSMVEMTQLTEQDKCWLNAYHQRVRETLAPLVAQEAQQWLIAATAPIASR